MPLKRASIEGLEGMKVFFAHGTKDELVTYKLGRAAAHTLRASGCVVEFHDYDMPHCTSSEEIEEMLDFITRVLPQP